MRKRTGIAEVRALGAGYVRDLVLKGLRSWCAAVRSWADLAAEPEHVRQSADRAEASGALVIACWHPYARKRS